MASIHVTITPRYDLLHNVKSLHVKMHIESLQFKAGETILTFPSAINSKISTSLASDLSQPIDDVGVLPVRRQGVHSSANCEWIALRDTSGGVKISYEAEVLVSETLFDDGPTTDLSPDQGGLIGSGLSFVAIPAGKETFRLVVEWNLAAAPEGTRAVWTFGEGPGPVEKIGPASMLGDSVYMVGPVHGTPATPAVEPSSASYGFYWFGKLPPNVEVIREIHEAFFLKVSRFFNDSPSVSNPYRHFVRYNSAKKAFGGTSFVRSHIFDYDDQIAQVHDYDLVRRMAHEMVHSFLGPSVTNPDIDWIFEGIKHTLSIYLPFRPPNQFRPGHYFQETLSMLCMKYYTSPYLEYPLNTLLELAAKDDAYAIEQVETRAWAFVIGTDFAARKLVEKTTPPQRPIEDLAIKRLAIKKKQGEPHGINQWLDLLTPLMGGDARRRYEDMYRGEVILLPVEVFGTKSHRLVQCDQEILDLGMDRASFEQGMVRAIKDGSRAMAAGLVDGDRIIWSSHFWRCAENFTAEMKVVVNRKGKVFETKFWPRSHEKARCWQMVKVEDA
ncbi:uncharacterized protein RSE6_13841 [Rhynchosporium secalis]|uniref:Peptidase M61 catalytic domain-containing protein n=1 Tax=Rhynchosporium secalis TaxID=38038 RepID=A0A1E1MTT0_RHYSE|nr:uncharacterized protein RSE6_13841 [Rhynchosporium secalis]